MFALVQADGEPLKAVPAGQYVVLRLRPRPDETALLHSYSLSEAPSEDRYRISVKREPHGAAGAYIDTRVEAGDILDVSAPRGSFTLRQGESPVVLVSAGIGATPVLAMLHALAAEQTRREIWWIHGARNSATVAPLRALIPDFAALLAMPTDAAKTSRIERAPTIGRPLGRPEWITMLERRLGRALAPGKPGPKPRVERDTARQVQVL